MNKYSENSIVVRRSHFALRGMDLFFLISTRPYAELSEPECELWSRIDGTKTVGQLADEMPNAQCALERLLAREVCEVVEQEFPSGRTKVLVIEPHMDDAVLSIGGQMWKNRHQKEYVILTVAGVSNFTSYYRMNRAFFDTREVSAIRTAESQLVARMLGASHCALEFLDSPLRYNSTSWDLDWYVKNKRSIAAFQNMSPIESEIESWSAAISAEIEKLDPDELWIPLGISTSIDHQTTRNACLRSEAITNAIRSGKRVYLYEDVPYVYFHKRHARQILAAIAKSGEVAGPQVTDITDVFRDKLRLISMFGSQFKLSYMEKRVFKSAQYVSGAQGVLGERHYRLKVLPKTDCEPLMYSGYKSVGDISRRLKRWLPRHRTAANIRVLCPVGTGRWGYYMTALLEAFPNASFRVYYSSDSLDETRTLVSDRIQVQEVRATGTEWIKTLMSLRVARRTPTIICTHSKLERLAFIPRLFFAGAQAITCTSLDHFVLAFRQIDSAKNGCGSMGRIGGNND